MPLRLPGERRDTLANAAVKEGVEIPAALYRKLARGQDPPSGFRELPARYGDDTAAGKTRRALLVGGTSVAPNTFVLGIDRERDVMIIHQLVVNQGEAEQ